MHALASAISLALLAVGLGLLFAELATGAAAIKAALGKKPIPPLAPRYSRDEQLIQDELARLRDEGAI